MARDFRCLVAVLFVAGLAQAVYAVEAAPITDAIAVMQATEGNKCSGTVKFKQEGNKLKIVADIEGLTPDAKHAIHIHEFGDASSKDGTAAGGHFNPEGHEHGLPDAKEDHRHAGDLGNLTADKDGKCHYELTVDGASVSGKNSIIGRSVIIHAKVDDGAQPTGNAGARIACGVIGIAKAK